MTLTQLLVETSIANDCSVNISDLSKMLFEKKMKYFDVPLDHESSRFTRPFKYKNE